MDFVKIWQSSSTLEEALKKLGLSESVALKRAASIRKKGTPLKLFGREPTCPEELGFRPPSYKEFMTVWSESKTLREAAGKLGLTEAAILYRAKRYREVGADLKQFGQPRECNAPEFQKTFVRAWKKAKSVGEVASKLDLPVSRVHSIALVYRRRGVELKSMRPPKKGN